MLRIICKSFAVILFVTALAGCSDEEIQAFLDSLNNPQKSAPALVDNGGGNGGNGGDGSGGGGTTPTDETPGGGDGGDGGGDDPFELPDGDVDPRDPIVPVDQNPGGGGNDPGTVILDDAVIPEPATAATALVAGVMLTLRAGRSRRRD